jgi:hypothetical protein
VYVTDTVRCVPAIGVHGTMKQVAGQSSPSTVLPSSHVSLASTVLFPQQLVSAGEPHFGDTGRVVVVGHSGTVVVETVTVVVVVGMHVQAAAAPGGVQALGQAVSPPEAEASHASPPAVSRKPSPHVEGVPVNDFAGVFFALIFACSVPQAGDGIFPLSRTLLKVPHCGQRAVTAVNFFPPTILPEVAPQVGRVTCPPEIATVPPASKPESAGVTTKRSPGHALNFFEWATPAKASTATAAAEKRTYRRILTSPSR